MTDMVDAVRGYELTDRYRKDDGRVFLSGAQALARLPFEQLRADRRAGLDTAAFVSGYPGSPLAGYDRDVTAVAALAERDQFRIVVQPAVNEELAATAVMGSQLATTMDGFRHDGVVGIWYGKAPGLDRASDAIRHAVFAGTARHGGVVALVGDDPGAKSSTLPSSSGATLVDLNIPVLFPGDVQEAVELGRHAVALSRASGLWTVDQDRRCGRRRHGDGRARHRLGHADPPRGARRREALRAATLRQAAHAVHARHGA